MSTRDQAMILTAICSGLGSLLTHGHPIPDPLQHFKTTMKNNA